MLFIYLIIKKIIYDIIIIKKYKKYFFNKNEDIIFFHILYSNINKLNIIIILIFYNYKYKYLYKIIFVVKTNKHCDRNSLLVLGERSTEMGNMDYKK